MAYWAGIYVGIATLFAVGFFVTAGSLGGRGVPAADRPGSFALLAGLLWPVLIIGATQVGLWMLAVRLIRSRQRSHPESSEVHRTRVSSAG